MKQTNPITVSNDVQNQRTNATLRIPGTDLNLAYDSTLFSGDNRDRVIEIDLSPDTQRLLAHVVEIDVAGQHHETTLSPSKNSYTFEWDGKDGQGRPVQGTETASVRVGNRYEAVYQEPRSRSGGGSGGGTGPARSSGGGSGGPQSFGNMPGGAITGNRTRTTVTLWRAYETEMRYTEPAELGFGGWRATLQRDAIWFDGERVRASTPIAELIFGEIIALQGKAFGPDGTLYLTNDDVMWAIDRDLALSGSLEDFDDSPDTHESISEVVADPPYSDVGGMVVDPDGTIYVSDYVSHQVFGVDPADGSTWVVAGNGKEPGDEHSANLAPNDQLGKATATPIDPSSLAVGPEGCLYVEEYYAGDYDYQDESAIRRITQSGYLEPIAGAPASDRTRGTPDDGVFDEAPTDVEIRTDGVAVNDEGTVYFSEVSKTGGVILSVESDGKLRLVSGDGATSASEPPENGTEATNATYSGEYGPRDLLFAPNGALIFEDNGVLLTLRNDGTVWKLLGSGDDSDEDLQPGDPATIREWGGTQNSLAVAADGTVVFDDWGDFTYSDTLGRVRTGLATDSLIAGSSGRIAHRIGDRHEKTLDAMTGATRRTIEYDGEGRAEAFVDAYGNRTTVERDGDGRLAAIEAPTGQRTTFDHDSNGYLSTATLPDGRVIDFAYTRDGLLTRVADAAGTEWTFAYDSQGRVEERTTPDGTTLFARQETPGKATVTQISPEGRETSHTAEYVDGNPKFTTSCCGGVESSTVIKSQNWEITRPDGGSRTLRQGPDPRFGMLAPVTERAVETSPGGRETTTETERTVTLSDRTDPLSVQSHTDTITINGSRTYERVFDGAENEFTITTPEGRSSVLTLDDNAALDSISVDGVDPVTIERNGDGRITKRKQAGTVLKLEYDDNGYLAAVEDETGRRTEFGRDVVGRIESATEAGATDGAATDSFTYDDAGNITAVERPNGDGHEFVQGEAGRLTRYEPPEAPDGGGIAFSYDADGLVTTLDPPSGRTIASSYDTYGRLTGEEPVADGSTLPATSFDRDGAGRIRKLTWSPGTGSDQTVSIERDGAAVTAIEYGGAVSGRFEYDHDANGFVTGITFPDDFGGSQTHTISHDDDGLTTGYGPFTLTRDGPDGAPTELTDGTLTIRYTYDNRGRVDTRTHEVNGTAFYEVDYTYDEAGRIESRTRTVDGASVPPETFTYDDAGRLDGRTGGTTPNEAYGYDANGNRTARTLATTTLTAAIRSGDRLRSHDQVTGQGGTTSVSYTYDADGFVSGRGGDRFTYSPKGDLLEATPDGGSTVTYTNDAHGRIVARTVDGDTTEYLYGDPNRPWQLTVARAPDGTRTRYYYDPFGRVVALDRGGTWHYVATDQVGSPRVVAAADGSIEKRLKRDSYGVVLNDSNPGFTLHVDFAGGIRDPDTGLVRLGVRDYEPRTGRFTARDPILLASGQFNYYTYADGDPVNAVDRTGLASCWWQETVEDYNTTMDNASPVRDLIGEISGDRTGPQGTVEDTLKTGAEEAVKAGAKEGVEQLAKGASRRAAATAAGGAAAGAGATAVGTAAATEVALRASVFTTSGISNMWDRSLTDRIASGLFEADPLGLQTVDDPDNPLDGSDDGPGGGGSDCGSKSPDNC